MDHDITWRAFVTGPYPSSISTSAFPFTATVWNEETTFPVNLIAPLALSLAVPGVSRMSRPLSRLKSLVAEVATETALALAVKVTSSMDTYPSVLRVKLIMLAMSQGVT